jgi:hypothetical protein
LPEFSCGTGEGVDDGTGLRQIVIAGRTPNFDSKISREVDWEVLLLGFENPDSGSVPPSRLNPTLGDRDTRPNHGIGIRNQVVPTEAVG